MFCTRFVILSFSYFFIYYTYNLTKIMKLFKVCGLVAQAIRRQPPTAGAPSSRLGHSMWVSWWTKRGLGRFFSGFSRFPLPQISFHHFSTIISSISFHFISPCDGASGVVGRQPTLATHEPIIQGLHRISSLDLTLCWTRVEDIYLFIKKKIIFIH